MNRFFICTFLVLFAFRVLGQGTINFANVTGQEITNYLTHAPVPTGSGFVVGMYYGVRGTLDASSLILLATTTIQPIAGRFTGGTVVTPNTTVPGDSCVIQIRAWSGGYASYEAAFAAAVGGQTVGIGASSLFTVTTGNLSPPATTPGSLAGLNPFVLAPEPPTFALGLLGLGALAIFRRRK